MEQGHPIPPRLDEARPVSGRIGLGLALVAPAVIALMVLLHPG
jgi:hypothetical protein